jgi:hypothetical protein
MRWNHALVESAGDEGDEAVGGTESGAEPGDEPCASARLKADLVESGGAAPTREPEIEFED